MQVSDKAEKKFVHSLSFGIADAFRSARYGFNARNIWAFFKGLLLAWLVWVFFVYLGFFAAGDSVGDRFNSSILCPLPDALFTSSTPGVILLAVGTVFALFILMITSLKVSKLTFEQLRGDQFYSEKDAGEFCRKHRKPVLITPLTVTVGILAGFAALLLLGLAGRIPGAGPFIVAVFAVPAWLLGLLLVFALIALLLSFFLVPAIVASTGGDTFECLFELFSIISSKPSRIFRGILAGLSTRIPALVLLLLFGWGSVFLVGAVTELSSGFTGTGPGIESGLSRFAPDLVPFYSSIFSPVSSTAGTGGSWTGGSGVILSASGFFVFLAIISYWFSSCTAMWTVIYLGARYSRDSEDLLLRAEEEEYREFRRIYGSTDRGGDRKSQ